MKRKKHKKCGEDDFKEPTKISVADFSVESSKASLTELEECMNRLIKQNKNFAEVRRKKILGEMMGMIG